MKLKNLLCFCLLFCAMVVYGSPVDSNTAMQVARNFWAVNAGKTSPVDFVNMSEQSGFHEFYIFVHPLDKGYVIVSADDCVQPVIAYSLNSRFDFPLPEHVWARLQAYEEEIAYYKSAGIRATSEITEMWQSMLNGSYTPRNTTSVEPMLTTTWNQSPYYNNLCPDSAGIHAVTGCAATATAQVMKFWNWPVTGTGSHTYTDDNFGTLTANFGATTYQWSVMPNALDASSTTAQVNAVATLMFHVGVAIEMDYGINSSGAYTNSYGYSDLACSENALKNYFGYKSSLYSVYKNNTNDVVWVNTLTAEMDAGRPVIEAGHGGGGHAFVCDGYDNNGLFHINWGWGSAYDGYFAHNALNPGGGGTGSGTTHSYNEDQSLVVGIEPNGVLRTNVNHLLLPQEGGTASFTVTSNNTSTTSWTATSNQSWLTVSPNTGYGSGVVTTVNVTATANNTGAVRTAVVTITQGTQTVTVNVSQNECSSADMCTITVQMSDSYGDGWNGSYLTLSSTSGYVYGTATVSSGSYATQQFNVCPSALQLAWTSGSQWDSECSFVVYDAGGQPLLTVSSSPTGTYSIATPCTSTQPPTTCEITTFPWTESFENSLDCWNTIDADGDGNVWGRTTSFPYDGSYTMYSYSYDGNSQTALNAKNYLVSPLITLPATGNYELKFYARSANNNYPDSILVKLSSTGNTNASSFGTTLMSKTMISATYQQYTVSLSGRNGQSFYLAFVHDSYDGLYLLLDNVTIVNSSQSYTITATSANSTMGYVTGGGTYAAGDEVTLEAVANAGYRFTGWNDGSTDNPRSFAVTGNAAYTATFADLGTNELHYDNGSYANSMGAGGTIYWAVRFPANVLTSYNTLNSVRIWDQYAGSYEVRICQGGTDAPGTQLASQTFSLNGTEYWYDATFSSPVTINPSQPLWIVLYNTGVNYPAACSNYAGNPDGSWLSLDGSTWNPIYAYGDFYYTWMIRPVLSAGSTPQTYTVTATSTNSTMGYVTGGGTYSAGEEVSLEAVANAGYRFTGWNDGSTENPRSITVTGNVTYIASFANLGTNELHYDNGSYVNSMGAGGTIYWAVRFPANVLTSYNTLNSVRIWDQYAGSYEVRICQGGTDAPGTQLASQTYSLNGSSTWFDATFSTPVTINPAQPLWIVLYNTGVNFPAACSNFAGNPDGSWVSLDGTSWNPIYAYGDFYYTWMIRPVLSTSTPPQTYTITVLSSNDAMGTATGGGTYSYGTVVQIRANPYTGYEFTTWNDGNTANPRNITVTGNATYVANFQPQVGINDNNLSAISVYSHTNQIVVCHAEGESIEIYDMLGKRIAYDAMNTQEQRVFTIPAKGVYLVRVGDSYFKKVIIK